MTLVTDPQRTKCARCARGRAGAARDVRRSVACEKGRLTAAAGALGALVER